MRATILNAIMQRLGGAAGIYNRVNGTNMRAGEEECLPWHRKVKGEGMAFLETKRFENIGNGADFAEKLVDDGHQVCIMI